MMKGAGMTLVPVSQALPQGMLHGLQVCQTDLPGLHQLLLHQVQMLSLP